MLGYTPISSASPDETEIPSRERYARNTDYSQPANAETRLWISCVLDHGSWPARKEIAISRTGLVVVLYWNSQSSARLVPFRIDPWQVRRVFYVVDQQFKIREGERHKPPKHKNEPYLLSCDLEYARPHRSGDSLRVYSREAERTKPLMDELHSLLALADSASESKPGVGPPTIAAITTDDISFLPQFLAIMHLNYTLTPVSDNPR